MRKIPGRKREALHADRKKFDLDAEQPLQLDAKNQKRQNERTKGKKEKSHEPIQKNNGLKQKDSQPAKKAVKRGTQHTSDPYSGISSPFKA